MSFSALPWGHPGSWGTVRPEPGSWPGRCYHKVGVHRFILCSLPHLVFLSLQKHETPVSFRGIHLFTRQVLTEHLPCAGVCMLGTEDRAVNKHCPPGVHSREWDRTLRSAGRMGVGQAGQGGETTGIFPTCEVGQEDRD